MSERDLHEALISDLEQIEDNARLFYELGRNSAYQAVAIQLRNLVGKGRRGLLERVIPEATLHLLRPPFPLPERGPNEVTLLMLDPRGHIELGGSPGGANLILEFSETLVPVGDWLKQWIFTPEVTLDRLITDTANDEVAHTERTIAAVIEKANAFKFGGDASGRQLHAMAVVALGVYIVTRTRELLRPE